MAVDKSKRAHLRVELSQRFIPYLQSLGFQADEDSGKPDTRSTHPFGAFVRKHGSTADVIDIQFDKYQRPRFIINFSRRPPRVIEDGWTIGPRNARLPRLTEFGAERFRWAESFRLTPRARSARWFTVRTFFGLRSPKTSSKAVVDRLMNLFPQVEAWFNDGSLGDHIQALEMLVPIGSEAQNKERLGSGSSS